jgi:hypothetical protein
MRSIGLWVASPVFRITHRRFGEICRLHIQGRKVIQTTNRHEAGRKFSETHQRLCYVAWLTLRP